MDRVAPLDIAMDLDQLGHESLCPELCRVDADVLFEFVPPQRLFFFSHDERIVDRFCHLGVVPWVHSQAGSQASICSCKLFLSGI